MPTLSPAQIYALARNAGLSPAAATTATAVALAESGGRTDALGDQGLEDGTWGPSVGLWQIRSQKAQYGTGGTRDASRLTDPSFNAASMAAISGQGQNFSPWTTYTSGAYRSQLSQVSSSVGSSGGDSGVLATIGRLFGTGLGGVLGFAPAAGNAGAAAGTAADSVINGWQAFAVKALGGAAGAALVVVGAVHTVSAKG